MRLKSLLDVVLLAGMVSITGYAWIQGNQLACAGWAVASMGMIVEIFRDARQRFQETEE